MRERFVPPPLKLGCNQSMIGIDRIVLAPGARDLKAGLLERQLLLPERLMAELSLPLDGL